MDIGESHTSVRTVAACVPPITEIFAFGQENRNRGSKALPHIPVNNKYAPATMPLQMPPP